MRKNTENIPYGRGHYGIRLLENGRVVALKNYSVDYANESNFEQSRKAAQVARKNDAREWLAGNEVIGSYSIK